MSKQQIPCGNGRQEKQVQQQTQIPCGNGRQEKQVQQQTQIPCGNDKRRNGGAIFGWWGRFSAGGVAWVCDDVGITFMMRRVLAIVLFAASVLPALAPMLLAGSMAEASVPMCCRRNGAHHCDGMMMGMTMTKSGETMARAPRMNCPFQQHALGAVHLPTFTVGEVAVAVTGVLRAPTSAAQAECLRRISFDRSRQKRGPPVARLS